MAPAGLRQDDLTRFPLQPDTSWRRELPTLVSDDVTLRPLRMSDGAAIISMVASPGVVDYISPGPATLAEARGFIDWTDRARRAGRYICFAMVPREQTSAAGLFEIWPLDPDFGTAEWGFWLGRTHWGTGVFLASASLVADFAFERLGTRRIEGRSAVENGRGNAALRKLGAVAEGRLRQCFECTGGIVRDHILWALLRDDWRRRPLPARVSRSRSRASS